jgi:NYN domain
MMTQETMRKSSFEAWALSLPEWGDCLLAAGASWETFSSDTVLDDLKCAGIPFLAARTIVQKAKDTMERNNAPMIVFWDMDSTAFTGLRKNPGALVENLQAMVTPYGQLIQFRCYTASTASEQVRSSLLSKGCLLIEGYGSSTASSVDAMIAVDAIKFAYHSHADGKATLCFASASGCRFSYLLAELKQWRTVVVSNQKTLASISPGNDNNSIHLPWPESGNDHFLSLSPPPGLDHLEPYELDVYLSTQKQLESPTITTTGTTGHSCSDRDVLDELYNRTIVCDNEPISPLFVPRSLVGMKIASSFFPSDDASDAKCSATTATSSQEDSLPDSTVSSDTATLTAPIADEASLSSAILFSGDASRVSNATTASLTSSRTAAKGSTTRSKAVSTTSTNMMVCWLCQESFVKKEMVPVCHRPSKYHCQACYNWGTPPEKARAVDRVVALMKSFALHDDIVITDSLLRHKLVERYPETCLTLPRATLWIEGAIKCGALDFLPYCGARQKCVCLPEHAALARAPAPPHDFNTTKEEAYLKELLVQSHGWKTRRAVIAALSEKFPQTMSTAMARSRVIDNACSKHVIILRGNATTQVLAFQKAVAESELERLTKASQAAAAACKKSKAP